MRFSHVFLRKDALRIIANVLICLSLHSKRSGSPSSRPTRKRDGFVQALLQTPSGAKERLVNDRTATISPPPLSMIVPAAPAPTKPGGAARTKLMLEGPILPTLLRLSTPNVLNFLAFVGMITFDGFFLGRLGTDVLAGASLAFPFVMLVLQATNSGMGNGVSTAIARALGGGKRD